MSKARLVITAVTTQGLTQAQAARVRRDRIDDSGVVTLRVAGRWHHIGVGRTHARTHVLLLIHDLHIRVVNAITGELLRELVLDPSRDYQPTGAPKGPTKRQQPNPVEGSAVADVLRHHIVGVTGFEPATSSSRTVEARSIWPTRSRSTEC